ncbi:VP3 [Drosophila subobscura Nora virus]|uniref:VP3 n=1 Tax=Drosophila subobscura Nora virus TaxID=1500865 RepID=UPI0004D0B5DC|nr:VP3 [Drosophila subobscura Nora virus]AHZ92150.1 VP3 [Drosophila subobscura Nora virus]
MALKEEIFDQNTTLFSVLDENEVTETKQIQNSVTTVQTQIDQQKLQLDGLAKVVDQNQSRNEEQFVNINTIIVGMNDDIDKLKITTTNLVQQTNSLNSSVAELETFVPRVNSLEVQTDANTKSISALEGTTDGIQDSINTINDGIVELKDDNKDLSSQIQALDSRITILESKIKSSFIEKSVQYKISYSNNSDVQRVLNFYALGPVKYGQSFSVMQTPTSTFSTTLTINRPYPQLSAITYPGVPVLIGMQVSLSGTYPMGTNVFESLKDRPAIIYSEQ